MSETGRFSERMISGLLVSVNIDQCLTAVSTLSSHCAIDDPRSTQIVSFTTRPSAMTASFQANGRKRRRKDGPFNVQHGLTLLLQAGSATFTAVLIAATHALELSSERDTHSSQPSQLLVNDFDGSNGSSQRRGAADVDEENWHSGQPADTATRDRDRHINGAKHAKHRSDGNNGNDIDHSHTVGLRTLPPTAVSPGRSSRQPSPRVKVEPVSSRSSQAMNGSATQRDTSRKKRRAALADSGATETERAVSAPRGAQQEGTPAAKRSLYKSPARTDSLVP